MVVAGAQRELVVVAIFRAHAPLDFLQLFLESVRCIGETLEDAANGGNVVVFLLHALLVCLGRFAVDLLRIGGHEQFVGVGGDGEAVVFIDGNHQRAAQSQVRGDEFRVVVASEGDFRADVRDVHTQSELTLAVANVQVVLVVESEVGGEGRAGLRVVGVVVGEVAVDEAQSCRPREFLAEHHRVGYIDRQLIGLDGHGVVDGHAVAREKHFAEREIAQRARDGRVVANAVVAGEVGQVHVAHELSQPGRVVQRDAGARDGKGIFRGVPVLRVHVGLGGHTHVAHTGGARVGRDGLRGHRCVHRVEHIFLVLCAGDGCHDDKHACQDESDGLIHAIS